MSSVDTTNVITLKGSAQMISEFFEYAVNSIIYQRAIYPPENFKRTTKYGLPMVLANDESLQNYIKQIITQLNKWLETGELQCLILVITGCDSNTVLERWAFTVETDKEVLESNGAITKEKPLKTIQKEIQAIMRQITASVTFLPLLEEPCTFELLVYANKNTVVPSEWEESGPKFIKNSNEVRLRSFTTSIQKVDASVTYKCDP